MTLKDERVIIILDISEADAHLVVDGCCGPLTEIAVISFQKMKGLKADAIVGPKTWEALKK